MVLIGSVEKGRESISSVQPPVSSKSFPKPLPDNLLITYLQMRDWSEFRPAYLNYPDGIKVMCMDTPDVAFYRFLYTSIGKQWHWRDRLSRSDDEIKALLSVPGTSVHVLYVHGAPAGYIELARHTENCSAKFHSTEIAYFGLRPGYIRQGFGKHLLSHGIAYAWNKGTQRLWVHTCNLDDPNALKNYINRGFKVYKVEKNPMPDCHL
jgi:ribosomal protein S18 acetylase RimI-like enzyme